MFSSGESSFIEQDILSFISEPELASHILKINELPCTIPNPMRADYKPSLGWFIAKNGRVRYKDFATNDSGTLIQFLCNYYKVSKTQLYNKLLFIDKNYIAPIRINKVYSNNSLSDTYNLECHITYWRQRDIDYWKSYGVPLNWLKWAEVYPIDYIISTVNNNKIVYKADDLAYVFVEHKENKSTIKIYQPYNKYGRKWLNKHDKSVIGLWTKVPQIADKICICASLKDSLCLSANTGIPAIYLQGEGYGMSRTAIKSLYDRYKQVYILLDNDESGITNGIRLANETGFTNLVLPKVIGTKDISDVYHLWQDKDKFINYITPLFN